MKILTHKKGEDPTAGSLGFVIKIILALLFVVAILFFIYLLKPNILNAAERIFGGL